MVALVPDDAIKIIIYKEIIIQLFYIIQSIVILFYKSMNMPYLFHLR